MTEQEAIEILEQDTKTLSEAINEANLERVKNVLSGRVEANNMAIKALEKQIPKKPLHGTVSRDMAVHCSVCNRFVCFSDARLHNYCPNCGQAIDWSGEE